MSPGTAEEQRAAFLLQLARLPEHLRVIAARNYVRVTCNDHDQRPKLVTAILEKVRNLDLKGLP